MKICIAYQSLLGTTKRYAGWLAHEVGADLFTLRQINEKRLQSYGGVVVMSGTYAGHMPLVNFLKQHWQVLQKKKLAIVPVGVVPLEDPGTQKALLALPDDMRAHATILKLPGKVGQTTLPQGVKKENLSALAEVVRSWLGDDRS